MARPRKCSDCGLAKPPSAYALTSSTRCIACSAPVPAPTPETDLPQSAEALSSPPAPSAEAVEPLPTPFPEVEIDPANPTHRELASRYAASKSLLQFIRRFRPKYLAGWVHEDICRRLERFIKDVEEGKSPRLLLMMPVRHGKSEICSRNLPAFALGHHPDWEIIATSAAKDLTITFSRYIRDVMRNPSYQGVFPGADLDPTSQSVESWNTTAGGGYLAAGIGSAIIGRGAHILIIDDPVKDAEAADSQTIRDGVWEWYMSTAYTRLAPGGGVLGILTWWNDDDWAGRVQQVMATGEGDMFEIVKYPAINEFGDEYLLADDTIAQLPEGIPVPPGAKLLRLLNTPLHPARYTAELLKRTKANYYALGQQRWWSALFQQSPSPEDGSYFTKDMIRFYGSLPHKSERTTFQAWDFAITEKSKNDYTVGVTMHMDVHGNLHVADVVRFKSDDSFVIVDAILDAWEKHGCCAGIGVEDGQIWKSISAVFDRRKQERELYPSIDVLVPLTDKLVRAQPLRGRMQSGKIWFNDRAPWWEELRKELMRFDAGGKHDDQIDALAWCVRLALKRMAPVAEKPKAVKSWRDKLPQTLLGEASHMAA